MDSIHQKQKLLQIRNELEALAPRTAGFPQNPLLDPDTIRHDSIEMRTKMKLAEIAPDHRPKPHRTAQVWYSGLVHGEGNITVEQLASKVCKANKYHQSMLLSEEGCDKRKSDICGSVL